METGQGIASDSDREAAPIGSLGRALADVQSRAQTITLVVTAAVAILAAANLLPALATPLGGTFGSSLAIWMIGAVGWVIFVAAVGVVAILPPLLLPEADRAVMAVHSWIGAREIRRVFGSAARAIGLPRDAASANEWLATTAATDINRFVRVDAFLLAGRFEEARDEVERLPDASPLDAYRKLEARALVADQTGGDVDEDALREAVAALPRGIDRAEAAASLAVFRARRALPGGDWRAPLLEVRSMIPGSDARVLVSDFGLPIFEIMVRRFVAPFTILLALIALSLTLMPAVLR